MRRLRGLTHKHAIIGPQKPWIEMLRGLAFAVMFAGMLSAQTDWPVYGHDPGGARYSPLRQINTANVAKLRPAWTYRTGEVDQDHATSRGQRLVAFEATPLVIGRRLYFSTPAGKVIALNAENGKEIWKFDTQPNPRARLQHHAHRGVAYWPGDARTPARILSGTQDGRLIALNAETGRPVPGFGNEGYIDLRQDAAARFPNSVYAVTSPPVIYRSLVIIGAEVPEWPGHGPSG